MSNDLKVSINTVKNQAGIIAQTEISNEDKLRVVIADCGATNEIVIRARIIGQLDWDTLKTITGNDKVVVSIKTYDELQIECTVFDPAVSFIRIAAGSFNDAGGSTSIDAPTGGLIQDAEQVTLTSSNGSVTIVSDPLTNTIDFTSSGGGSPFIKYVKTVILGDWTGPSAQEYTLSIPFSFHGVTSPTVACFETDGATIDFIMVPVNVDASNNVIIKVPQTPDSRFVGKVIIE